MTRKPDFSFKFFQQTNSENFLFENKFLFKKAQKLSNNIGLFLLPKLEKKKTPSGTKGITSFAKNKNAMEFFRESFEFFFNPWMKASAFSMICEESFPNVCLDCDDIHFLFESDMSFFVKFLLYMKSQNCLILSSPVYKAGYRFKICFQFAGNENFQQLENFIKNDFSVFYCTIEKQATIFGAHYDNVFLKPEINDEKWPVLTMGDLQKIIENDSTVFENFENFENFEESLQYKDYEDLLFQLFTTKFYNIDQNANLKNLSSNENRKFYKELENHELLNSSFLINLDKNLSINSSNISNFQEIAIQNIQSENVLLENSSINISNSPQNVEIFQNSEESENFRNIQETTLDSSFVRTQTKLLSKGGKKSRSSSFSNFLENLEKESLESFESETKNFFGKTYSSSFIFEENSETSNLLQEFKEFDVKNINLLLEHLNKEYKFSFKKLENTQDLENQKENDTYIFHSKCIFKILDENEKVLTFRIFQNNCTFYCYHQSCQENKKYSILQNEINSMMIRNLIEKNDKIYVQTSADIQNLLEKLLF